MTTLLLQTKLYIPPIRPELVSRPRLIDRLNAGFNRGLTLISAPAGFGKTTLVSEWVNHLRSGAAKESQIASRVAWLSLDESDNDPTRFLTYLIAALRAGLQAAVQAIEGRQGSTVGIGQGALSALQSPQPPPVEAILTALINEIVAIPDRIVFVLDDYHLIEAQPIHDALAFLLQHLPPQMHLVIATREDPPLPLARLRARGQLTELRAMDLRFISSEAAAFLNQVMGLELSAEDVAALEIRTEGWIAGLHLGALAMQGALAKQGPSMQGQKDLAGFVQSFTGSHHFVLDYLVEEVLEQQSESVQSFLLQTAVLDRMTGSLCDAVMNRAVTGQGNGQAILEMLEHANLFIVPLDDERRWYRYHHLFADLLYQRLRQNQPQQVPALYRRTSNWYEKNGYADEAIEYALRAEDFERAAALIEENIDAIWERGEHTRLRRWLAELPAESVFSRPHLCIIHAWNLFTSGQHDAAEQSLQAAEMAVAERALEQRVLAARTDRGADRAADQGRPETSPMARGQPSGPDKTEIQGRAAAIRAFLASYRGDVPGTIQHARLALEHLPERDSNWRSAAAIALGDAYSLRGELAAAYQARLEALEASKAAGNIHMIASLKLADTCRQLGRLQRTIEICQQQWQLAQEIGMSQTVTVGWLLSIWGEALAERNDLDEAIRQAKKGVELVERGKDAMVIGWSNLCLVRVLFCRGELAGAQEIVKKMEVLARKHDLPPFITNPMAAWQARLWLAQDKLTAASQWVAERGLDAEAGSTLLHELEYMVLARILIAQGQFDRATRLILRLLEPAETGGHTLRAIELLNLQALASEAQGDTAQAMTTLERALILAEPKGFCRVFVDEGPPMARLLYKAATRGILPDYASKLLAAFPDLEAAPVAKPQTSLQSAVGAQISKSEATKSQIIEPLSERELQVLELIAEGLTNPEIASRLFVSLHTIKAHAQHIYGKLGVHNRTQAVTRARACGILPST